MLLAEKVVGAVQIVTVFVVVLFWIGTLGSGPESDWRFFTMPEIGAFLSSEEHGPPALVAQAQMAESAGRSSSFPITSIHGSIDRVRARSSGA